MIPISQDTYLKMIPIIHDTYLEEISITHETLTRFFIFKKRVRSKAVFKLKIKLSTDRAFHDKNNKPYSS